MKHFLLISTDHLRQSLLFRDTADFIAAMNFVAIVAFLSGVKVLSFVLMSNHVHFVVYCSREDAEKFINRFKKFYSAYYQHKYGGKEFLRRLKFDIRQVDREDESLQKAIAYVHMNPVAANLCLDSTMYSWGTGQILFNMLPSSGKALGNFSTSAQRRILHSKVELPQDYRICSQGYIEPSSYVPVRYVERIFSTPKRLLYFLNTSSKARARLEKAAAPTFNDQLIQTASKDLLSSLYRVSDMEELQEYQKRDLIEQLQRRFSADLRQICRVTGVPYEEADAIINGI